MRITGNDVLDFSCFFSGVNEPPFFYKQIINPQNKLFVPADDLKMMKLTSSQKNSVIIHHYVKDSVQNKEVFSLTPPLSLYDSVYAVCSKDLSVDSRNNFEVFNNSNILKARIYASQLQTKYSLLVILTLIWGDETTYKWAFGNIEKGSCVSVSSQGITDPVIFENGLIEAIKIIQPEYIFWYGNPNDFYDLISSYYDFSRIIPMQSRTKLIHSIQERKQEERQPLLFSF